MSNLGKLSDKIRDLLARQVKQRGIVVWYDPEKAYTRLAEKLSLPETTVLLYADGFFSSRPPPARCKKITAGVTWKSRLRGSCN